MGKDEENNRRLACLEFAVQLAKQTGNTDAVIPDAQKFWRWMNGSHNVGKTPDDDISF